MSCWVIDVFAAVTDSRPHKRALVKGRSEVEALEIAAKHFKDDMRVDSIKQAHVRDATFPSGINVLEVDLPS